MSEQWIPVMKEQPPYGEWLVVTRWRNWGDNADIVVLLARRRCTDGSGEHYDFLPDAPVAVDAGRLVTHWMPLPDPPEVTK